MRQDSLWHRNVAFRRFFAARVGSGVGDWFNEIAVLQIAYQLAHSAPAIGILLAARRAASVVGSLLFGWVVDRFSRRDALVALDILRTFACFLLILAFVRHSFSWLVGASALLSLFGGMATPAEAAALPFAVADRDLLAANSAMTKAYGVQTIVGAVLGGLVAGNFGAITCLLFNAATFLWSAMNVVRVEFRQILSESGLGSSGGLFSKDVFEALRNPYVAAIMLIGIAWGFAGSCYYVIIPTSSNATYNTGSVGIGALYAIDGCGLVLGGTLVARVLSGRPRWRSFALGLGYIGQATFLCLLGFSPNFWFAAVSVLCLRLCSGVIIPLDSRVLQRNSSDAVRGRLISLHVVTYSTVMQLGFISSGFAMARFGVPFTALFMGLISAGCGAAWLYCTRNDGALGTA